MSPQKLWTEEEVAMLKTLRAEGLSASQTALRMNAGFTKNAVIGKLDRLRKKEQQPRTYQGISATLDSQEDRYARGCVNASRILKTAARPPPMWDDKHQIMPTETAVTIYDLRYGVCRMPVGDHDGPVDERLFCGARTKKASVYCAECYRICYLPLHTSQTAFRGS